MLWYVLDIGKPHSLVFTKMTTGVIDQSFSVGRLLSWFYFAKPFLLLENADYSRSCFVVSAAQVLTWPYIVLGVVQRYYVPWFVQLQ